MLMYALAERRIRLPGVVLARVTVVVQFPPSSPALVGPRRHVHCHGACVTVSGSSPLSRSSAVASSAAIRPVITRANLLLAAAIILAATFAVIRLLSDGVATVVAVVAHALGAGLPRGAAFRPAQPRLS
jgi:hypothetical protein